MTKFYLVAEPDDGLPPIRQEISAKHHAAYTGMENILSTVKLCECDADGMSKATNTYIHGLDIAIKEQEARSARSAWIAAQPAPPLNAPRKKWHDWYKLSERVL